MAEYIKKEAVINFIENGLNNPDKTKSFGHDAIEIMAEVRYMPAADVVEVKHGKWIESEDDYYGLYIIKCSLCREVWCFEVKDDVKLMNYNYCPNCGARMDGDNL